MTSQVERLRAQRIDSLRVLTAKYPTGFVLRTAYEEYKHLYKNYRQISTFMIKLRKNNRRLSLTVVGGCQHKYTFTEDPQAMLNRLWKIPSNVD